MKPKQICFFSAVFGLSAILIGCSDNSYLSEKLFWEAERTVAGVYKQGVDKLSSADYEKIIAIYRKVVDAAPLEPMAARAQFAIAGVYTAEGKYRQAQKEFLDVITNFSAKPKVASEAQLGLAKLYEAQGKWQTALEEYDKLMDLYPLTPLGLSMPEFIVHYYQNKNDSLGVERAYARGVRHYLKVIEEFSETDLVAVVQGYLANLHAQQGNFKEAIAVWSQIIDAAPESAAAIKTSLLRTEAYAQGLNDKKNAIASYLAFIEHYPKYAELAQVHTRLGALYLEDGQFAQAHQLYSQLLKDYPKDENIAIKAYLGLSYCYRKEARTDKVIEIYNKIKTVYPASPAALSVPFLIAQYYDELKYKSETIRAYQEAIEQYQNMLASDTKSEAAKKEVTDFLAVCYIKTGQVDKALQLLRMLSERYPKEPMYLLDMAALYANLNDSEKAVKIYDELIKKYPDNRVIISLVKPRIQALKAAVNQ